MNEENAEDLYDLALSDELIEQRITEFPAASSTWADSADRKKELEQYAKHFRKLVIGARKKINELEKEKEELDRNLKLALESGGVVICPNCTHHFKDRHNSLKPRYMKAYRANKCIEIEFDTVDDLNAWLYLNQLETNPDGMPTLLKNCKTEETKEPTLNTVGSKLSSLVEKHRNDRKRKLIEDDEKIKQKIRIEIKKESEGNKQEHSEPKKRCYVSPQKENRSERKHEERRQYDDRRSRSEKEKASSTTSSRQSSSRSNIREEQKYQDRDRRENRNKERTPENADRKKSEEPVKKKLSIADRLSFVGKSNENPGIEKLIRRDAHKVEKNVNEKEKENHKLVTVEKNNLDEKTSKESTEPQKTDKNDVFNPKNENKQTVKDAVSHTKQPSAEPKKKVFEGYKLPKNFNKFSLKKPVEKVTVEPIQKLEIVVPLNQPTGNESTYEWKIPKTPVWDEIEKAEKSISPPPYEPEQIEYEENVDEVWKIPKTPVMHEGKNSETELSDEYIDIDTMNMMNVVIPTKSATESQSIYNSNNYDRNVEQNTQNVMEQNDCVPEGPPSSSSDVAIEKNTDFVYPLYNNDIVRNGYNVEYVNYPIDTLSFFAARNEKIQAQMANHRDDDILIRPVNKTSSADVNNVKPARRRIRFEDETQPVKQFTTSTPKRVRNEDQRDSRITLETAHLSTFSFKSNNSDEFDPFSEFFPDVDKNNLFGSSVDKSEEKNDEVIVEEEKEEDISDELAYWMNGDGEIENEVDEEAEEDDPEECESHDSNDSQSDNSSDNESDSGTREDNDGNEELDEKIASGEEDEPSTSISAADMDEVDLTQPSSPEPEKSFEEKEAADESKEELDWDFEDDELFGNVFDNMEEENNKKADEEANSIPNQKSSPVVENKVNDEAENDLEDGEISSDDDDDVDVAVQVNQECRRSEDDNKKSTIDNKPKEREIRGRDRDIRRRVTVPDRRSDKNLRGKRYRDKLVTSYANGVQNSVSAPRRNRRSSQENRREYGDRHRKRPTTSVENESRLLRRRN